ncbi:MAG: hypothetical protein KDB23_07510 [Planctomycetales bacterium]|nr:hypothetical protein [Planctomycetales bacterium]
MTSRRQQVRKVDLPSRPVWEERPAAMQLAWWLGSLYALGIGGYLLRREGALTDDQLVFFLGTGFVLTALGSLALPWIKRRWLKRGFVVALMTSLLFNATLAFCLAHLLLRPPFPQEQAQTVKPPDPEEEQTLAEFFPLAVDGNDRPELDLRRPVVTGEPDLEQEDRIRKTTVALPDYDEQRPDATPPTPDRPVPMTLARREMADTVPRRFDAESTLSRQTAESLARLGRPDAPTALRLPPATEAPTESASAQTQPADTQLSQIESTTPPLESVTAESVPEPPPPTESPETPTTADLERAVAQVETLVPDAAPPPALERADLAMSQQPAQPRPLPTPEATEPAPADEPTEAQAVAAQPVATPETRQALSPDSEPAELDPETPSPLRPDLPELTRAMPAEPVPPDEAITLPLAEREPLRAEQVAPTLVDVENEQTQQVAETFVTVTPGLSAVERSQAPTPASVTLPSPELTAATPRPVMPVRGRQAREDQVPGSADIAASTANVAKAASGDAAREMTSPLNRPTPRADSMRSLATVRPEEMASQVPIPQVGVPSSAAAAAANPAVTSRGDASSRQGMSQLADTLTQPGQTQIEVGSPQPSPSSQQRRTSGGGQPDVVQPLSEQTSPVRRVGGDARPALPSVVAQPQLTAPAEQQGAPIAAASAQQTGRATAANSPTGLEQAETLDLAGAPTGPVAASEPRLARASLAPIRPNPAAADGGAAPVARRQATVTPVPTARDANIVQSGAANAERDAERVATDQLVPSQSTADSARPTGPSQPNTAGLAADVSDMSESVVASSDSSSGRVPAANLRRAAATNAFAPSVAEAASAARSTTRSRVAAAPAARQAIDVPAVAAPSASVADIAPPEVSPASLARATGGRPTPIDLPRGGLAVAVDAVDGIGGLSSDISLDVGSLSRKAQRESEQVVDSAGRFLRQRVGGILSVKTDVIIPAAAYQTRINRLGESPAGGNGRPSPKTEEAIELGLIYLASRQLIDGSWSLGNAGDGHDTDARRTNPRALSLQSDTGATGLCLLSFLGAGYHHRGDKYRDVVHAGLQNLVDHQKPDGDLYVPQDAGSNRSAWLYSHAIASIALCEAYGMTQDPELLEPAQRAIDFIVSAQHRQRGGWRYQPGVGSDTSVSGWMVMALRSAELANLNVPHATWEAIDNWLNLAQASDSQSELYRYNPYAPNTREQGHGRRPSKTMTAVGLLMRMYTGWRRDDAPMLAGADYLKDNPPAMGTLRDPQRDTYYWYYATQVMFHMRGEYWEAWNQELHPLLTSTQLQTGPLAGSWDPDAPLPDRWANQAGRVYVTTLNLLSLEVYYRHLPIYEDTAR